MSPSGRFLPSAHPAPFPWCSRMCVFFPLPTAAHYRRKHTVSGFWGVVLKQRFLKNFFFALGTCWQSMDLFSE